MSFFKKHTQYEIENLMIGFSTTTIFVIIACLFGSFDFFQNAFFMVALYIACVLLFANLMETFLIENNQRESFAHSLFFFLFIFFTLSFLFYIQYVNSEKMNLFETFFVMLFNAIPGLILANVFYTINPFQKKEEVNLKPTRKENNTHILEGFVNTPVKTIEDVNSFGNIPSEFESEMEKVQEKMNALNKMELDEKAEYSLERAKTQIHALFFHYEKLSEKAKENTKEDILEVLLDIESELQQWLNLKDKENQNEIKKILYVRKERI